jgi:hypothetical protein
MICDFHLLFTVFLMEQFLIFCSNVRVRVNFFWVVDNFCLSSLERALCALFLGL